MMARFAAKPIMVGSLQRVHSQPWSRAMRCLLVIAAWQAPLPFWHNHGTLASQSAESPIWLAKHLRTHHATVDLRATREFGWHVHFAFPDADEEAPGAPDRGRQPGVTALELAAWDACARLQAAADSHAADDVLPVARLPFACPLPGGGRRPGGFFMDFAPHLPLPVRLGVLRC